jgi:hypothetical protein
MFAVYGCDQHTLALEGSNGLPQLPQNFKTEVACRRRSQWLQKLPNKSGCPGQGRFCGALSRQAP